MHTHIELMGRGVVVQATHSTRCVCVATITSLVAVRVRVLRIEYIELLGVVLWVNRVNPWYTGGG